MAQLHPEKNKEQELEKLLRDDFAIKFSEWKEENNYWHSKDNKCFFKFGDKQTKYKIKQLLEMFKIENGYD